MSATENNGLRRNRPSIGERRPEEFLAMLAHELRNPLAPISSALEILQMRGDDPQVTARAHEIIGRQVRLLTRLVEDLLDISRIARGSIEIRRQRLDVGEALATAIEQARPAMSSRGHRLELRLCPGPLTVEGDAARLAQVFANLLNNSAKYTEPGGRIVVTSERRGAHAVVRVRDNGIGIAPAMLPALFELFSQAESKHAMGGLGVGLALARQLVELHGGRISAHSEGIGQGSEFTVQLPLAAALDERNRACADVSARTGTLPNHILVVEDNVDAAESLATMLRLWGHEVAVAHDGLAAVTQATHQHPDVMIVDLGLPLLDGCGVAARVRESPGGTRIGLVALTGYGQEHDRQRALRAGFNTFLVKPVNPDALRSALASAVDPGPGGAMGLRAGNR